MAGAAVGVDQRRQVVLADGVLPSSEVKVQEVETYAAPHLRGGQVVMPSWVVAVVRRLRDREPPPRCD